MTVEDCEWLTLSEEEGMKEISLDGTASMGLVLEKPNTFEEDNLSYSVFGVGEGLGRNSSLLCTDLMLVLSVRTLFCLFKVSWC